MQDANIPPRIQLPPETDEPNAYSVPPQLYRPAQESDYGAALPPPESAFQKRLKKMGPFGVALATLLAKIKTLFSLGLMAFKVFKYSKIVLTVVTMVVSVWAYSLWFGVPFAIGFVILIFVHEMGHVFVAWRQGLPISAPIFIPFFGALVRLKRTSESAWADALLGIGGPVAGSLGGLVCLGVYFANGSIYFLALASVTFLMNLFNLMPIVPLDGGRIVGAVSPWLWLVGLVGLVTMTLLGHMRNPMVWLLVIASLPRVWSLFKRDPGQVPGLLRPPTMSQRLIMGACYFSLAGSLMLGQRFSHEKVVDYMRSVDRGTTPVATLMPRASHS